MSTPVDLTNLRSMTDGDREMEAALFEEFNRTFDEGLSVLEQHLEAAGKEPWRTQAHALKGVALNLGADELSALCKQAQEGYEAAEADKSALVRSIRHAYDQVRAFLEKETSN